MQIAKQIYKIQVAENVLVFFQDGEPAYLTKRFDVKTDGTKWGIEDFASLAGKTQATEKNFKYNSSYEAVGKLLRENVVAWNVEIEKYFRLVIFNYLFSNGDAHLKNFSLLESSQGDYLLSPAYDLLNTRIHVADTDFALKDGLFIDDFKSNAYQVNNQPSKEDFLEFGKRIGVKATRAEKILKPFLEKQDQVALLIQSSFLSKSCQKGYQIAYNTKRKLLNFG